MTTHADTGKRKHSSDEESSSPTGTGHIGAAGRRAPARPNKIPKSSNGKETMDADFEAENASFFIPTLDGPASIAPSTSSPTENVKTSIPRPPLSLPTSGIDPSLPLGDLEFSPGEETAGTVASAAIAGVTVQLEHPRISHPDSASELYGRLAESLPAGHSNVVKAWFHALSLPCWPERVKIAHDSRADGNGVDDAESVPALPSSSQSDVANAGAGAGGSAGSKVKERHYTACKLSQATLTKYCNWRFTQVEPPTMDVTSAKGSYAEEYHCPKSGEARFIHSIEERPKRKLDPAGNPEPIHWLITNHLLGEVARMKAKTRFVLPEEWRSEVGEPPLSYNPPDPDPYHKHLPPTQTFSSRVPTEQDPYPTVTREASPPEVFSPRSQEEESSDSIAARNEIEALCKNYIIDESPEADGEKNTRTAILFYDKFNLMNLPSDKLQARVSLFPALARIGGQNPCFRMKPRIYIKEKHLIQCFGDVTDSEDTDSIDEYPPTVIMAFLRVKSSMKRAPSEEKVEKIIGNLLAPVVTGKGMSDLHNTAMVFPPCLRPVGSSPRPDLYVRASADFGWPKSLEALLPTVYAGEGKRDSTVNVEDIRAQLATAFHATLVILILYYLDTRKELTSALPPWLFLYGIEYTEFGINICAHFPSYDFDEGRWYLESTIITQEYSTIFATSNKPKRMHLVSNLYRIRSHSVFVLQQLRDWSRAEKVLGVLLKGA